MTDMLDALRQPLKEAVRTSRECEPSMRASLCTRDVLQGCRGLIGLREAHALAALPVTHDALRLLRNLCAECPEAQVRLFEDGALDEVLAMLRWIRAQPRDAGVLLAARLCGQVLANACVRNMRVQAWLWRVGFPPLLTELADDDDAGVRDCACMCIYNCALAERARLEHIAACAASVRALVRAAHATGLPKAPPQASSANASETPSFCWALETVGLLVHAGLLPAALASLRADVPTEAREAQQANATGAADADGSDALSVSSRSQSESGRGAGRRARFASSRLLRVLEALGVRAPPDVRPLPPHVLDWCAGACTQECHALAAMSAGAYARSARARPPDADAEQLDVLRALVHTFGSLVACDLAGARDAASAHGVVRAASLALRAGLDWAPPVLARDPPATGAGGRRHSRAASRGAAVGLKSALARLLANVCFRNPRAQAELADSEGLVALLHACRDDDDNAQLREWALFAVRNACEGCPANQAIVAQLERTPRQVVNAEELEAAGMEVTIDRRTGKLGVRNAREPPAGGSGRAHEPVGARNGTAGERGESALPAAVSEPAEGAAALPGVAGDRPSVAPALHRAADDQPNAPGCGGRVLTAEPATPSDSQEALAGVSRQGWLRCARRTSSAAGVACTAALGVALLVGLLKAWRISALPTPAALVARARLSSCFRTVAARRPSVSAS